MDRIKFAVAREDPDLESELVRRFRCRSALVVASGGCTALTLAQRFPDVSIAAFDRDEAQLAHVEAKRDAAARGDLSALNVQDPRTDGLNQCGEVEGLLRILRRIVEEFVAPPGELAGFFDDSAFPEERARLADRWISSRHWPAAFDAAFHEGLLAVMFGAEVVDRTRPGSYAEHFRRAFERGLRRPDAAVNPFIQHALLGAYKAADAPDYVRPWREAALELVAGGVEDVPELGRFDLFSLSSTVDGMDDAAATACAERLAHGARKGSVLLLRRLNGDRDVRPFFAPHFVFHDRLGSELLGRDRSLMYSRIEVAFRTGTAA